MRRPESWTDGVVVVGTLVGLAWVSWYLAGSAPTEAVGAVVLKVIAAIPCAIHFCSIPAAFWHDLRGDS